ncbi:Kef-type K+ transport system, membrane component [Mesorhizobium prunaredense]|uniref:Kef-type K+ transport system, membrane component n=1 Tax=Mesorhizobium prunaredense TaxID=1631249 RepID=A0A1R3VF35_9HYPH|nr:cation:proton antiporter [Mesorhizobium prunaredense]SIT58509.1 Kef-type K+ transport system, membrane component [Mesorhizobium prunaredense]
MTPSESSPGEYQDVVLFLVTAGIVVPLFRRMKLSPILGFLAAGVVLGPSGLGSFAGNLPWLSAVTIDNPAQLAQLAELGVVFLLFMIGLELSWERLRLMRRLVFGFGGLQVAICGAVIAGATLLFGQSVSSAVAIGAALALSSTAIVMPLLAEAKRQHSQAGRATFAVLLFQDLAVAPILITLAVLGSQADNFSPRLLFAFVPAALGLMLIVVVGRLLLRPMLRSVAKARSEELFVAACLLVVIGAGVLSAVAGLSMALGAFIAGLLLAETEFRHEVEVTIEPFKGLLLGLFFLSVGIGLDLSLMAQKPVLIVGLSASLILLNGTVIFALARLFGFAKKSALEIAFLLAASGEFAFVILFSSMNEGLLDRSVGEVVLVSSTLSMFCIPFLAAAGAKLAGRPDARSAVPAEPPAWAGSLDSGIVLVMGYGRVGRLVGDMLSRHNIAWVAAELDTRLVEAGRRRGHAVWFGDASRAEFLKRCGLEQARAVIVTMDDPEAAEAAVACARELRPELTIVARARDARHAKQLYEIGATETVPDTIEASLQLSEAALLNLGIPMGLVIASIHERRAEFRKELDQPEAPGGRSRQLRDAAEKN